MLLGQSAGAQTRQATDLLYSGERFDGALQQYHLRARHYNQANGQFTSLDPYSGSPRDPQSLHKYAYCHSDPVNGIDPSGENFTLSGVTMAASVAGMLAGIAHYNYAVLVQKQSAWPAFCASLTHAALAFIVVYHAPAILAASAFCVLNGGVLGGMLIAALMSFSVCELTKTFAELFGQAAGGAYSPLQVVAIVGKMLSIVLTGYLAGFAARTGPTPAAAIRIQSSQGSVSVQAKTPERADSIAEGMRISPYRVTVSGETFIRYESANPAFSKIAPSGGVKPGTGMGYQIVSVVLCDGRRFDQVAVVEGRITQIRGLADIPFTEQEIAKIILTHDKWDFNAERHTGGH